MIWTRHFEADLLFHCYFVLFGSYACRANQCMMIKICQFALTAKIMILSSILPELYVNVFKYHFQLKALSTQYSTNISIWHLHFSQLTRILHCGKSMELKAHSQSNIIYINCGKSIGLELYNTHCLKYISWCSCSWQSPE